MTVNVIRMYPGLCSTLTRFIQYTVISSVSIVLSLDVQAASMDCLQDGCGTAGDGYFPHLVLGTVDHVATEAEQKALFQWAQTHHYWQSLPPDEQSFVKRVQPVSIRFSESQTMMLLMAQDEYDAIQFSEGDFVRYTYHPDFEHPPEYLESSALPYWHLYGCIAVLCRADDKQCLSRYDSGIFAMKDGQPLDTHNYTPLSTGTWIDPSSYLPTHSMQ